MSERLMRASPHPRAWRNSSRDKQGESDDYEPADHVGQTVLGGPRPLGRSGAPVWAEDVVNLQGTRHGRIQRASAARVRYEKRRLPGRQAPEFRSRWLLRPGAEHHCRRRVLDRCTEGLHRGRAVPSGARGPRSSSCLIPPIWKGAVGRSFGITPETAPLPTPSFQGLSPDVQPPHTGAFYIWTTSFRARVFNSY